MSFRTEDSLIHASGVPELVRDLVGRIEEGGPLPFDEFMEAALYHPEHGYYASGRVSLGGPGGDFRTSPEVHPIFGEMLARQAADMYRHLGRPETFRVVELGPGTGSLAAAFLQGAGHLPPHELAGWEYHLVERSTALVEAQKKTLEVLPTDLRHRARWSSQEDLAARPADGLVLANEFYDALPVRRVRMTGQGLQEIRVGWKDAVGFVPVAVTPQDPHLPDYFRDYGAPLAEGQEAEASLEALQWADHTAGFLRRGYWVTIDYGDSAERLYGPARRRGTLLGYRSHRVVDDPLRDVGLQDLTAHVNFTALVRRGRRHRVDAAPLRSQTEFLLSLGILDRMEERDREEPGEVARLRGRMAAKELFAPGGMGETFRVLIQAREAPLEGLRGLSSPWRALRRPAG